jgi:hypothetical protein
VDLDVWGGHEYSILELGIANDMDNVSDYFALKLQGEEIPGQVTFSCYDERDSFSIEGITPISPSYLSLHVNEDGSVSGIYADEFTTYECPLASSISSDTVYPAIILWSPLRAGYIEIDNLQVRLD